MYEDIMQIRTYVRRVCVDVHTYSCQTQDSSIINTKLYLQQCIDVSKHMFICTFVLSIKKWLPVIRAKSDLVLFLIGFGKLE